MSAVQRRLTEWAKPAGPRNTVLHWVGHGWSNDVRASMAYSESDAAVDGSGLTPEHLANIIRKREQSEKAGDSWAMVLIDGCRSARFAEFVHSSLLRDDPHATERVLLLGVSREGETRLGVFSEALELGLGSFRGSNQVRMWDLADQLRHRLPNPYVSPPSTNALLTRRTPVVAGANAPLDTYEDLTDFIRSLSIDERLHLIPQASGAEYGDAAWYFVGRQAEKRRIAAWLKNETSGMLVVTGDGGQGKSALLGNIAALSRPRLRRILVQGKYIAEPAPDETPPDHAFQGIVHATGMDRRAILESVAKAAGYPAEALAGLGVGSLTASLAASLSDRDRPFTFLVDALDEAASPRDVADVLHWLAEQPRCAVVVGTRPAERQRQGAASDTLLDALAPGGLPAERLIVLDRDPEAVRQYVMLRLQGARGLGLPESDMGRAAAAIAAHDPAFLGARLAVHEVISRIEGHPAEGLTRVLSDLAATGLQEGALFEVAMRRVMATSRGARPLLLALALSEGRGMPRSGDVWASAATAGAGGVDITEQDIDTLLRTAAPYVLIDTEDEHAVYRLSHEVFRSLVIAQCLGSEGDAVAAGPHADIARSLAAAARRRLADADRSPPDRLPPPYVRRYLAAHAAHGEVLEQVLLRDPGLVLALDHTAVAEHAASLSPESAQAVFLTLQGRTATTPSDGDTHRHPGLAALRLWARRTGAHPLAEACVAALASSDWALEQAWWSGIGSRELCGHTAGVQAVNAGSFGGQHVVVSAAADNTVRVWQGADAVVLSAQRPTSVAVTRTEGEETVTALCDGALRAWNRSGDERIPSDPGAEPVTAFTTTPYDAKLLYATAATLEIRTAQTDDRVGWHHDTVLALASARFPETDVLLSGSADHSARLWNIGDGSLRTLLTGHTASVLAVAVGTVAGQTLAATAGADRRVIVWDCATGKPRHVHSLPSGSARSLSFGHGAGRDVLIAGCEDSRIRVWDAVDGTPQPSLCGHTGPVHAIAVSPADETPGAIRCVSGSDDSTIRLWNVYAVKPGQTSGLSGAVRALCWTAAPTGESLLVAADSEAKLWTYSADNAAAPLSADHHHCGVQAAWSCGPPGSTDVLLHGEDDELWLWNTASGSRTRVPGTGPARLSAAALGGPARTDLITADTNGWVRLYDLRARKELSRHRIPITCRLLAHRSGRLVAYGDGSLICRQLGAHDQIWSVPIPGRPATCLTLSSWAGREVVALGDDDGNIRLHHVDDGSFVTQRRLHESPVTVVAAAEWNGEPAVVSGADDGSVCMWGADDGLTTLTGHAEPVYSLAFGPGGRLATAGAYGSITLWRPTP
ncbi:hypothetical protein [Streptomyces sp. NBC_00040]|uniref:hypothetical protein n=1 Tax=Streptomyces sp. NBC_00040 TaxID=2903616 RepID=UPI003251021E